MIKWFVFGLAIGSWTHVARDHYFGLSKDDLIRRGLAEYCATDGRFAFKGECGDE